MLCQKISPGLHCPSSGEGSTSRVSQTGLPTQKGVNLLLSQLSRIPHENLKKELNPRDSISYSPQLNQRSVADSGLLHAADLWKGHRPYYF